MLKKLALLTLLAMPLFGCAATPDLIADKVTQVQAYARLACAFVPTVATVAGIFNAMAGASVQTVGSAICNAVTINPLADGPGAKNYRPTVAGVRVHGAFVK